MENNENLNSAFSRVLREWLDQEQPEAIEMPEYAGINRAELEKLYPGYYIEHDANRGNLELRHQYGVISCLMENDICVKAYFIMDE